jgi:hypothetical protein
MMIFLFHGNSRSIFAFMITLYIELVLLSISLAFFATLFDNFIMMSSSPIFNCMQSNIDTRIDQGRQ